MDLDGLIDDLADQHGQDLTDAERVQRIDRLEALKSAAAAAQARITAAFDRSQRKQAPEHKSDSEVSRSIAAQVALARHESPVRGQRDLGVARALVHDMPQTLGSLSRGEISEWAAILIVRETACLSREDRFIVDGELAGKLQGAGDRRIGDMARGLAMRLDPGSAVRRASKAERDRRVTVRPAPDTMSMVTGLLPVQQGVAVYASLRQHAVSLRSQGDSRTLGQIMADTFFERLTGRQQAVGNIEIQLVMNERTLIRGDHEPAHLIGYGPVPSSIARRLVREADRTWIRRLFTEPSTGELVAMDSRRRTFTGKLRQLLVLRDQTCRTPWCDAPVAHADHVRAVVEKGATTAGNGQGLCETCNYVKQSPGWRSRRVDSRHHVVEIVTPTGETYYTHPPGQPGADPPQTFMERFRRLRGDVA